MTGPSRPAPEDGAPEPASPLGDGDGPREHAFVAVWFAVVIVLLLAFAALAVDVASWYRTETDAQKAVDAASLAGVVHLPDDEAGAIATAEEILARNGYVAGPGTSITVERGDRPNQLRVRMTETHDNYFGTILGLATTDIGVAAMAEYERPIAMGSPSNTFGNQPDCGAPCTNPSGDADPQFWMNVAGPLSYKTKGDAHHASLCDGADGCSGSTNLDYRAEGYSYIVRHAGAAGAALRVEVFDPAFVHVGDNCTDDGLSQLPALFAATGNDPRYASGSESQYCTGDQYFDEANGPGGARRPPHTSYRVLWTNNTPWTTVDDVEVDCDAADPAVVQDFPGHVGNLNARRLVELADPSTDPIVTEWFRRWVPVCAINGAEQGDYRVVVGTAQRADGTAAPVGGGHNRAALRVARNGSLASSDLSFFADGDMAIYANAIGASPGFHLARVLPGAAGRVLDLNFYDTGDASQPGTITVEPPPDARVDSGGGQVTLTSFADCRYTPPGTGLLVSTSSTCSVSGVSAGAGWNGRWIRWTIPIPASYDCDVDVASGCWIRIDFSFPGGSVSDTTTWKARLTGDPVRLVE